MSKKDSPFNKLHSLKELLKTIGSKHYFDISMCGDLIVPEKWEIEPRVIEDFHLVMVLSGKGVYTVDGVEIPLQRGRIIFVSHGIEYSAEQDLSDPPRIIPVRFFSFLNTNKQPNIALESPVAISHLTANVDKYQELFESLHRQYLLKQGPFRTGYCSMIIQHILSDLFFDCSSDSHDQEDNRIVKVQQFIASNPLDRSSLEDLSKMVRLSKKYFSKVFKNKTGVSPKHYQLSSRLSHAKELLFEGYSVKETAFYLGYTDPFIFSKQFKAIYGISPNECKHDKRN